MLCIFSRCLIWMVSSSSINSIASMIVDSMNEKILKNISMGCIHWTNLMKKTEAPNLWIFKQEELAKFNDYYECLMPTNAHQLISFSSVKIQHATHPKHIANAYECPKKQNKVTNWLQIRNRKKHLKCYKKITFFILKQICLSNTWEHENRNKNKSKHKIKWKLLWWAAHGDYYTTGPSVDFEYAVWSTEDWIFWKWKWEINFN